VERAAVTPQRKLKFGTFEYRRLGLATSHIRTSVWRRKKTKWKELRSHLQKTRQYSKHEKCEKCENEKKSATVARGEIENDGCMML
jgi:hypothetical protein